MRFLFLLSALNRKDLKGFGSEWHHGVVPEPNLTEAPSKAVISTGLRRGAEKNPFGQAKEKGNAFAFPFSVVCFESKEFEGEVFERRRGRMKREKRVAAVEEQPQKNEAAVLRLRQQEFGSEWHRRVVPEKNLLYLLYKCLYL